MSTDLDLIKEAVQNKYPAAFAERFGTKWTSCNHKRIHELGYGNTELAAWQHVWDRIHKGILP